MGTAQIVDCGSGDETRVQDDQLPVTLRRLQDAEDKRQDDEAAKEEQRQQDLADQKAKDDDATNKLVERQAEILQRAKALAKTSPELTVILELLGAL